MTRLEKARQAQALRDEGLLLREIAERMGSKRSTVHAWLDDPDGSKLKARKESYRGTCDTCGGLTDGSNGRERAATRCLECLMWTPDAVVEAIQDWAEEHGGVPPRCADAHSSGGRLPHEKTVARLFGSWNQGLLTAGFDLVCDRRPETTAAMIVAVRNGDRIADIADQFGCTTENIYQRLKNAGTSISAEREKGGTRSRHGRVPSIEARRTVRLYEQGRTIAEIAEILGLTPGAVAGRLRRAGVEMRPTGRRPATLRAA